MKQQRSIERLEPRVVLNEAPIAQDDPWYSTAEDTDLTVTTSDTTLVDNDWDPEGDSLTASIAVGGNLGPRTNLEEAARASKRGLAQTRLEISSNAGHACGGSVPVPICGELLTGGLELSEPLTPGLSLIYDSPDTLPQPIIVLETFLQSDSDVPDEINAQLTFNASAGTDYGYDTTSLSAGDSLRFALQADATSLNSGRYDYSVELTADMTGTPVEHTYSGSYDVVNRGDSTHPFGRGWQLAGNWKRCQEPFIDF